MTSVVYFIEKLKWGNGGNKTLKTLLRKYVKYREIYAHMKGLANIFANFSPSENNHVYSTL